jgi:hypothetical protein
VSLRAPPPGLSALSGCWDRRPTRRRDFDHRIIGSQTAAPQCGAEPVTIVSHPMAYRHGHGIWLTRRGNAVAGASAARA